MEIRIGSLTRDANEARGAALVIDVFRAFTTAAIAFDRGAERITLVAEVDEALAIRERSPEIADILMGEVDGKRPDGFDHGNSPFEASTVDFDGKCVVQSTRAGTVGTAAAGAAGCDPIYVTSLRGGRRDDASFAGGGAAAGAGDDTRDGRSGSESLG